MASLEMEAFVCSRAPGLLRRARLLTPDRHLAEDLAQDALTQAVVHWGRLERAEDPDAYLHRMLVNTFLTRTRRRSFTERPTDLTGQLSDPCHGDGGLDEDGTGIDLARALADLPPEQRVVLVLRYYDDLSVSDVAAQLGRSEAWVRQTSHRASQRLRGSPHLASPEASHGTANTWSTR